MSETFKIGDSVFVEEGLGGLYRWRGPFSISKQHKNGNVVLAGDKWPNGEARVEQYNSNGGHRARRESYSYCCKLHHDTPELREQIALERLRDKTTAAIRELSVTDWTRDRLNRLLSVINEGKPS